MVFYRRWMKIGTGVAAGVTTIIGLFILLTSFGLTISDKTGNIICEGTLENPCISEFIVNNPTYYNIDIYSKDQAKLDFSPEIYDYALFIKDNRCSATGSCRCELKDGKLIGYKGWRCIDFTNKTKSRVDVVYNFRFAAYSSYTFMLVGFKNSPYDTIKWGFDTSNQTLDPFWYSISGIPNISVSNNITMELGSRVNITTNLTGATTVCVDIDHPEYGTNYTCGSPNANFLFNISYFRNNLFNDSISTKNISWVNGGNQTVYINQHQYDEIVNVSVNVTGFVSNGTSPTNVKIYINNSLSNILGYMANSQGIINDLNDSSTSKNYSFEAKSTKTDYLYILKNTQIGYAYFNVTGFNILTGLEGVCYQESPIIAGGCGGLNTGSYYDDVSDTYYNDSDWSTRKAGYYATSGMANYQINYSRPTAFLYNGTKLQVKYMQNYDDNQVNITIPSSCLIDPVRIKINFTHENPYSNFKVFCFNTDWSNIYASRVISNTQGLGLYEEAIWWNFINNSLTNFSVEVGDVDGSPEYNYTGWFITTGKSSNFNNTLTTYLSSCTEDSNHFCQVPIYLTSQKSGLVQINNINISYTYDINPVYLDKTLISNFLGNSSNFTNIPITFESSQNGTLQISDIRFDYRGGNDTIIVSTNADCYHETATTTSCGSSPAGVYSTVQGSGTSCGRIYVNYTKPTNSIGATWQVKHGNLTDIAYNITIPSSCFNYYADVIALQFCTNSLVVSEGSSTTGSHSEGFCENSTGWSQITETKSLTGTAYDRSYAAPTLSYDGDYDTYVSGPLWGNDLDPNSPSSSRIYEEAIFWDLQENLSLINYYSSWDYSFPNYVDYLEFIPKSSTSKNVPPYGQTSNTPIFNITTENYGGKNMNLSVYINNSNSCVDILYSTNSTRVNSQYLSRYSCTQETANKSYDCGAVAYSPPTGAYWGNASNPNMYDENWSTNYFIGSGYVFFINYTIPNDVLASATIWKYRSDDTGATNKSCTSVNLSSCISSIGSGNTLVLKNQGGDPSSGYTTTYCWNGTSWLNTYCGLGSNGRWGLYLYEEQMIWKFNSSWVNILTNRSYLNNSNIWLWADYSCTNQNWAWWVPDIKIRGCAYDVNYCSTDLD